MSFPVFRHNGPWNETSRQDRGLRFVESYATEITSDLTLPYSPTKYFSPSCTFYDATDVTYNGADDIKSWMQRLFSPFDKLEFALIGCFSVNESDLNDKKPKYTVVAEFLGKHWFKGDPEPILAPRLMIFNIDVSETEDGFDGLQYSSVRLYWNISLVKDERARRALAKDKA
ncbi:uncharacterized protein N7458_004671 [Penicillium daleae]|uniref:Uncharacterized protein n=1 Tax=Penicillium daleae TaxID=63821 RepID=A0AAD6G432_9EURO|nr:uncharacterized protein N7458_004671 [Penicillium daleae]KAJ5453715.1 hypothetical protein N7458_004671 [Penicillium daleae]